MKNRLLDPHSEVERGQLMANMMRVFRRLKAILQEEAVKKDLSMTQFIALRVLDGSGGLTMGRLCESLDITQGASTTVVDKLIERGLVTRVSHATDRRIVLVHITDSGRELVNEILASANVHVYEVLQVLSPEAYEEVLRGFSHFAHALVLQGESDALGEALCPN